MNTQRKGDGVVPLDINACLSPVGMNPLLFLISLSLSSPLLFLPPTSPSLFSSHSHAEAVSTLNSDFSFPYRICMNPHDECLYICEYYRSSIKKLTLQGILLPSPSLPLSLTPHLLFSPLLLPSLSFSF